MIRSYMFVPADSSRKLEKSIEGEADALIFDLEDSVAGNKKSEARTCLDGFLSQRRNDINKQVYIRVNDLTTGATLDDLAIVMRHRPDGIVLPKSTGADDVRQLGHYLDAFEAVYPRNESPAKILPIVTETSSSLFRLDSYKDVSTRLVGLMWGAEDLAADIGAIRRKADGRWLGAFAHARALCLIAAANAGVSAVDAISAEVLDMQCVEREAREAKEDGFSAKAAIHPSQLRPINDVFTPSKVELAWAARIVAAFNAGDGVATMDGKMIDRPHLRLAERLLLSDRHEQAR